MYPWEKLDNAALQSLRFRDLGLRLESSLIWPEVQALYTELERRDIRFKPHVWLSTEWFSPDGVPGIAVPYFAAHRRLQRLERSMMDEVEGGSSRWRLRILRHEAGHALDTAFGLRRRAAWREVFGPASKPYPRDYWVRPGSRGHVLHLGHWYAQSHPTEDFAETFAVWLQPKARWRREYAGWPALRKLEYVDLLMRELAGCRARNSDRSVLAPLDQNNRSLGEHYRRKRRALSRAERRYDAWLKSAFVSASVSPRAVPASRLIRELRPKLRLTLLARSSAGPYLVDHAIDTIRQRVRQLDLVAPGRRRDSERLVAALLERVIGDVLRRNREKYVI